MGRTSTIVMVGAVALGAKMFGSMDILNGFSGNTQLSGWQLNMAITAFCFSPITVPDSVLGYIPEDGVFTLEEHTAVGDDDYEKASIYAILYALYQSAGAVQFKNTSYQFTFNTWGFAPSPYPESDPQRHGKAAYAGLATLPATQRLIEKIGDTKAPLIVEIGSGTGAGAHLISSSILPQATYLAVDMQLQAVSTCKRLHEPNADGLTCVHVPDGVGNGQTQALSTPVARAGVGDGDAQT